MEKKEFNFYINTIKDIWAINKSFVNKDKLKPFRKMKKIFEKSIYAKTDLKKGSLLKFENLAFKKPFNHLRADKYKILIGKKLTNNMQKDEPINVKDVK